METTMNPTVTRWMSVEELRRLIGPQSAPCVSITMSMESGGAHDQRARFEGLARQARGLLGAHLKAHEVDAFVDPILAWAGTNGWATSSAGLAVFRSRDFAGAYRLPITLTENVFVGERFQVRPLLEYLHTNQRYYMLVVTQGRVSFLKGGMGGLVPVEWNGLAGSLEEARKFQTDNERHLTSHSGARGGGAIFHGHGKPEGEHDEELAQWFREIDRRLCTELRDDHAPVILAAPPKQFALYSSISRHPHLMSEGLQANVAEIAGKELHARAWPIVQKFVREREDRVLEHYQSGFSRQRSIDELSFIARAAFQGRVRELLLARGAAPVWGRVKAESGELDLSAKRRDERDEDVLDDIAEAVLLRGGEVLSIESARMPSKSPTAATLRW